jgi:hypothetical protein
MTQSAKRHRARRFRKRRVVNVFGADRHEASRRDEVHVQKLTAGEKERQSRERRLAAAERRLELAREAEARTGASTAAIAHRKDMEALVAARERELGELAGVMVTIPHPGPARQIRHTPDDQPAAWPEAARDPRGRTLAELRRLNGLD